jgi:hypothetical protein
MLIFLSRRKIYDEYNDEEVELTKEETKLIRRVLKGKAPHGDFDPYTVCNSISFRIFSYKYNFLLSFSHISCLMLYAQN